jgi:glycosyltransferase involved in cell wall biosynthesis
MQKLHNYFPDIIYAHPGWGQTLYVKDIFPRVPLVHYCEFFYHGLGADTFFQPSDEASMAELMKIRTKNAMNLVGLEACDLGVAPTEWQRRLHPQVFQPKIEIIHDGIDTDEIAPGPDARFALPNGMTLGPSDEVVTYINRSLEPCRGIYTFADAVELIAKERPHCQFVVVGAEDGQYYGPHPPKGTTYKDLASARIGRAKDRVHFVGRLPRRQFVDLLRVSSAHIYLSSPFVLSWSMLEAMAVGCLVVGSTTPPVTEVIRDGRNGLLADFFSPDEVAERVLEALSDPERMHEIRRAARETVLEKYALKRCLPRQLELIDEVLSGRRASPAFDAAPSEAALA